VENIPVVAPWMDNQRCSEKAKGNEDSGPVEEPYPFEGFISITFSSGKKDHGSWSL